LDISTPRAGPSRKRIKRARSRSRSRSLTPPPPVSQEQLLHATQIYRQSHPQSSFNASDGSNTIDLASDDDDDGVELDPELLKIKQAIRQQSVRAESVDRTKDTYSEDEDEDPANQVMLVVTWVHNPEHDSPVEDKKEMKFPYPRVCCVPVLCWKKLSDFNSINPSKSSSTFSRTLWTYLLRVWSFSTTTEESILDQHQTYSKCGRKPN
jgi:hypothetical protein